MWTRGGLTDLRRWQVCYTPSGPVYLGKKGWHGDLRAEIQELKGDGGGCLGRRRNTL